MMPSFRILNCDQRSDEWRKARVGRLTASRAKAMLAFNKDKSETAGRRDLRTLLVVEQVTWEPQEDGFVNDIMQRGEELEPDAFAAYEARTGNMASKVGFLAHHELMAGGSPDGVVGDFDGLIELKCPKSATHWGYLRTGGVPSEHLAQLTHLLWLTGAPWIDFLSFDPRFPKEPNDLTTFLVRLAAKDVDLESYDVKVRAFLSEVQREVDAVKGFRILETVS